ncbi:MAG TPA: hypothetical protein VJM11_15300 [Nevskiaceae bacterium]|nr:hypothetical protein [Nevskiaceae bacterium]
MGQKTEDRGPGARKVEIEKRLDNNAKMERRASEERDAKSTGTAPGKADKVGGPRTRP